MAMTKSDFYKVHLKPREAYTYFLANKETDTTLLPAPRTEVEQQMYSDCVTAATALLAAPTQAETTEAEGSGGSNSSSTGG